MIRRNYGSGNMIEKKAHALETCQTNATLLMLHDPLLLGVTTNRPFPNEKLFMEAVNPLIYLTATGNQAPDAHQTTQLNQILQNDILGNCRSSHIFHIWVRFSALNTCLLFLFLANLCLEFIKHLSLDYFPDVCIVSLLTHTPNCV